MDSTKSGHHISGQFDIEIEYIRDQVLAMGGLVEQQVKFAIQAFINGDAEQAEKVIRQDKQVHLYGTLLDQKCAEILALRQPAALDLRMLIATIKIIAELERIGNFAEYTAIKSINLSSVDKKTESCPEIQHLYKLNKKLLHDVLNAFAQQNINNIDAIITQYINIAREYILIFRQLSARMNENPRDIQRTLHLLSTVRDIERIAEHAFHIFEYVVYLVKGENIRHLSAEEIVRKFAQREKS